MKYFIPENFKKIGEYNELNCDPSYVEYIGRSKTKKLPIVYLLVVEGQIKYIGETRQGYIRPLSYNKNTVMKNQREAIVKYTSEGKKVEVFALEVLSTKVEVNGMKIDCYLAQDYEKALIKKYNPEWNGRL